MTLRASPPHPSVERAYVANDQETKITTIAKSARPHIIIHFYSIESVVYPKRSP